MDTRQRNFRIPGDVWQAAQARAEAEHRTLTDVVIRYLRAYGGGYAPPIPYAAPAISEAPFSHADDAPAARQGQ